MRANKSERSVPNGRGRSQEMLAKRRANKRIRRSNYDLDPRSVIIAGRHETIDRETKQTDA